ncbi:hypothetical protein [Jatrophihabitans sp.]|uniref:hypothetical protein n=1 Tax=Jatrophihabitans sp. TaxID=1932789 RepID=UPI0030C6EA7A|nr:hypothetical protein [Jatrophihabitans sp.]
MTTQAQRRLSWGDSLVIAAYHAPGGLNHAVTRIQAACGEVIGSRNTFGKLSKIATVDRIPRRDVFRAWLLVVALGEDPADFGLSDDVVPPAYELASLRRLLPEPSTALQRTRNTEPQVSPCATLRLVTTTEAPEVTEFPPLPAVRGARHLESVPA